MDTVDYIQEVERQLSDPKYYKKLDTDMTDQLCGKSHSSTVRIPLLLNCGHSYCEDCLTRRVKQERVAISCPECKASTKLQEEGNIKTLLPDIYLLGLATLARTKHPSNSTGVKFLTVNSKRSSEDDTKCKKELCGECSLRTAACRCTKCEVLMCTPCFEAVHRGSKILRKHEAVPLYEDESLAPIAAVCPLHDDRPIEYFCEDDQAAICSHCVIVGEHQHHVIVALERKNKDAVEDLESALKTANNILLKLRRSDKLMASVLPNIRQKMLEIHNGTREQFRLLHALLQKREAEILAEIDNEFQNEIHPLDRLKLTIREEVNRVRTNIKDAQQAMANKQHILVNAQQILSRLQNFQEIPCSLVIKFDQEPATPTRFSVDKKTIESLGSFGSLEIERLLNVSMLSWRECPEEPDVEDDTESLLTSITGDSDSTCTRSSLSRSTSFNEEAVDEGHDDQAAAMTGLVVSWEEDGEGEGRQVKNDQRKKTYRRQQLKKLEQLMVHVTHIKNPCSFMVQRADSTEKLHRLSLKIQNHCRASDPVKDRPEKVCEGDDVLAQYTGDNLWYRALVRDVVVDDPYPDNVRVEVLYVDYGNSEVITASRLRKMKGSFLSLPVQALPASLTEIVSSDPSGHWTLEAVQTFANMTGDKPLCLQVITEVDGVYMVDLSKPVSDDGVDSRPVSVRDALIFLEVAVFIPSVDHITRGEPPKPVRRYITPEPLRPGDELDCVVSHAESPSCFYIQKVGQESSYLRDLMVRLQEVYGNDTKDLWSIFYPQLYLICVALYDEDNQWYRAQVVHVPGRCFVDVLYVDFGNIARVHYSKLRSLQPSFLTLPMSAIQCSMADVAPLEGDQWTTEALARFNTFISSSLKAEVSSVVDGVPQLILYRADDVCINSQLVIDSLALSVGKASQVHRREKSPLESQMEEESKRLQLRDKTPSPSAKAPTKPKKTKAKAEKDVNEPNDMKAIVTHVDNPGHLYVQLASAPKDGLDSLMMSLKAEYSGSGPEHGCVWELNDDCAARLKTGDKWYRTKVIEQPDEEGQVTVRSIDYGFTEVVPDSVLRIMTEEHHAVPAFALRAHLSGVQPAGDPNRWSGTSIDFTRDQLKGVTVYFLPKGDIDKGSFPCDLLVKKIIPGDALNPEMSEYKSVTDLLMERGVALPNRRLTRMSSSPQVTVPPKPDEEVVPNPPTADRRSPSQAINDKEAAPTPPTAERRSPSQAINDEDSKVSCDKMEEVESEDKQEDSYKSSNKDSDVTEKKRASSLVNKERDDAEPEKSPEKCEERKNEPEIMSKGDERNSVDKEVEQVFKLDHKGGGDYPALLNESSVIPVDSEASERLKDFAPAVLPTEKILNVVPTYVDWDLRILFHDIKNDEDVEGRFGYYLKESTLETIVQDSYLKRWGLYRARIPRDGNCLFRALAQAIYNDQCYQQQLRLMAVNHINSNWTRVQEQVAVTDKDLYLREMEKDGVYGGEPEIMAIAESCNVSVSLLLGGLDYPVKTRKYGTGKVTAHLIYISDGRYDCGHYDLAVDSTEDMMTINDIYNTWRRTRIVQVMEWPQYKDNRFYDDSILLQLTEYIKKRYENTEPESEEEVWRVGQPVIALYPTDNLFYRARITAIKKKGIKVFYVDFGNSHFVRRDQLRKKICLQDVPCQCLSSVLYDSKPNSCQWEWESTLNCLHSLVVDTNCTVEIMEEPKVGEDLVVKLTMSDGRDLATVLKEKNMVLSPETEDQSRQHELAGIGYLPPEPLDEEDADEEEEEEEEEEDEIVYPERTAPSPYLPMTTLDLGEMTRMQITQVNYPNKVYIQHVMNEEASSAKEQQRNKELSGLIEISQDMMSDAELYLGIDYVKPGMPCCVQYEVDKQWYRGEVLSVKREADVTVAGVLFVDYGSFEYQDSTRLKRLPERMLHLPTQALLANVGGLVPPSGFNSWPPAAARFMDELLMTNMINVLIKALDPELVVDLLPVDITSVDDCQFVKPIYQPLIDMGLARSLFMSSDGTLVEDTDSDGPFEGATSISNEVD